MCVCSFNEGRLITESAASSKNSPGKINGYRIPSEQQCNDVELMIVFDELLNSFGPFGRDVLLKSIEGGVIVTSDSRQIWDYEKEPVQPLPRVIANICTSYGHRNGDNLTSVAIITSQLLLLFDGIAPNTRKIRLLQALKIVISFINCPRTHDILEHFLLEANIWKKVFDSRLWAGKIWENCLVPAMGLHFAKKLIEILVMKKTIFCWAYFNAFFRVYIISVELVRASLNSSDS